jgi:hypothetical protein
VGLGGGAPPGGGGSPPAPGGAGAAARRGQRAKAEQSATKLKDQSLHHQPFHLNQTMGATVESTISPSA